MTLHITPELLRRHDRPGPRYTSYPTAAHFHTGFGAPEHAAHLQRAAETPDAPLSLYIHLPFCRARCLYCACNVVIDRHGKVSSPYLQALMRELVMVAEHLGERRTVTQLHFGGGTPTYYDPGELFALGRVIRENFAITPDAEVAVEVDPRVTTTAHLDALRAVGLSRISLGVQDFDPIVQEAIGRVQSVEQTRALIEHARGIGVGSVNIDLIYGLPHQTEASFARTIETVLELAPERLATYGFAYVPWVAAHQKRLPVDALPDPAARVALLTLASRMLTASGYEHIGMDHFARTGSDLCLAREAGTLHRNFMGYTIVNAPDMVGVGLSAISHIGGAYAQNAKKLHEYRKMIEAEALPVERGIALDEDDTLRAAIIGQLMCNLRLEWQALVARFGVEALHVLERAWPELLALQDEGMLRLTERALEVTELGQLFVRNVAMCFDRYLHHAQDDDAPRYSRTV